MNVLGLVVELLLLGVGLYIYLFARGAINVKDPERAKRADAFRNENGRVLRIMSLALAAIMLVNLVARLKELY